MSDPPADAIRADCERVSRRMFEQRERAAEFALANGLDVDFGPLTSSTDENLQMTFTQEVRYRVPEPNPDPA